MSKPQERVQTEHFGLLNQSNMSVPDIEEDDIQMKMREELPKRQTRA